LRATKVARSIRDNHRIPGLKFALAAHTIGAFAERNWRVLLMTNGGGAALDFDVTNVEISRHVARERIVPEHRRPFEDGVMVAGQFPFGKHQGAGCVRGNKLPEGFTSLTRSISKSPWAYISVMTWLLIEAPERRSASRSAMATPQSCNRCIAHDGPNTPITTRVRGLTNMTW
jgi:hypothetical protein